MKPRQILPILLLALVLSACGGSAATSSAPVMMPAAAPQVAAEAPRDASNAAFDQAGSPSRDASNGAAAQPQIDRLVIKTADISLQVASVREAEAAVRAKVQALGGYVVRAENSGADEAMTAQISFRVPAQRFDEALSGLQGLAKKVLSRTVSGDDVTRGKPDPQVFLEACRRLSLEPASCAVIEDAPVGIEAARRAGTKAVAVAGETPPEAFAQADLIVPRLSTLRVEQIIDLLGACTDRSLT